MLNDSLRTFDLEERALYLEYPWSPFLSAVALAITSTAVHTTLDATPAELVFQRDMILPVQMKANWDISKNRRQALITKNNCGNKTRIPCTHSEGGKIMLANTKKVETAYRST